LLKKKLTDVEYSPMNPIPNPMRASFDELPHFRSHQKLTLFEEQIEQANPDEICFS